MIFFAEPNMQDKLIEARRAYGSYQTDDEMDQAMSGLVKSTLEDIIKNSHIYDKNCTYTIEKHKANLTNGFPKDKIEKITLTSNFLMIHELLCELDFHININETIETALKKINSNIEKLPENIKKKIHDNTYRFPVNFIKDTIKSDTWKLITEFKNNTKTFNNYRDESAKELLERTRKVDELKTALDRYEQAFNFVGLHDGFKSLHENKNKEKNLSFWGMIAIFSAMLLILLLEVISAQSRPSTEPVIISHTLLITMPLVAIEILLIYLFRVVLANYQSIKKQLLQIELRMTLCQFIQSYTEYANKMKAADKASLEKFENLIFSGIVMDDQQLPSTFDGIEQISKMMSALKSGPK